MSIAPSVSIRLTLAEWTSLYYAAITGYAEASEEDKALEAALAKLQDVIATGDDMAGIETA